MYSAESDSEARAALQYLEQVRAYFIAATHSRDPGNQPVRIVVFHSEGDFTRYRPAEYAAAKAFSIAGAPATIGVLGLKADSYERVFLEYCQLVMDESAPRLPYWIRAGLSQFYSTLKPGENTMKLGSAPARDFHSHSGANVDMLQLIGVDRNAYLASRSKLANDFYADTSTNAALGKGAAATTAMNALQSNITQDFEGQAWTLTHMLMFGQDYRAKVGELIGVLGSGQETGAAFSAVYGRSLAQVGSDLQLYMKQASLFVVNAKFNYEKPAAPQVKTASKDEQDRVFAELSRKK